MKNYHIVIDTMGADKGPEVTIEGAKLILEKHPNIFVTLVGDESFIKNKVKELSIDESRITIVNAPDAITNNDNIAEAFFSKPNASVLSAIKELKNDDEIIGLLTAGNSGAILMGSMKYNNVDSLARPCLSAILPSEDGGFTCLVDCGASIDVNKSQLHQFAKVGTDFMRRLYKIERPRVALLSNGVEDTKGNKLVKETFPVLKEDPELNFVGNVEGSNALKGTCDVLVCDGFVGNQILKATEAAATRVIKDVVKYIKKNNRPDMMPIVQDLMSKYDLTDLGGAIVLGGKKTIIKCHGSSGPNAFMNTAEILINLEEGKSFFGEKNFQ